MGGSFPVTSADTGSKEIAPRPEKSPDSAGADRTKEIKQKYQKYIDKAVKERPDASNEEIAQRAWDLATKDREEDAESQDSLARDVEHYAFSVWSAASGNAIMQGYAAAAPIYDLAKFVAIGLRNNGLPAFEKFLRSNKDRPVSEPSFRFNSWRGLFDGWTGEFKGDLSPNSSHDKGIKRP